MQPESLSALWVGVRFYQRRDPGSILCGGMRFGYFSIYTAICPIINIGTPHPHYDSLSTSIASSEFSINNLIAGDWSRIISIKVNLYIP